MRALDELASRARNAGVRRMILNGSFVTAKREPRDVDVVVFVPQDFPQRVDRGDQDAVWLDALLRQDHPKLIDLFAAVDEDEYTAWIRFFQQEWATGLKGLVEVEP